MCTKQSTGVNISQSNAPPSPKRKSQFSSHFTFFMSSSPKERACFYVWRHKKLETVIFSSPPSSLTAPTFAPLSPTPYPDTLWYFAWLQKQASIAIFLRPKHNPDRRNLPHRPASLFHAVKQSSLPGGKWLDSSSRVKATVLPRGLAAQGEDWSERMKKHGTGA